MDAGNAGDPAAESNPWLHLSRQLGMLRETTAESFSDRLLANLAAGLTGGSEAGRQLGGSLGLRFSPRINWNASLNRNI
jgi:hypothetical protein